MQARSGLKLDLRSLATIVSASYGHAALQGEKLEPNSPEAQHLEQRNGQLPLQERAKLERDGHTSLLR